MADSCLLGKTLDGVTTFGTGYVRYPGVDFARSFRIDVRIRTRQPFGNVFLASDSLG